MDTLTAFERSEVMRRVRGKDTTPEMTVRKLVHRMGYRYRLHGASLPGKPDLVFSGKKKVIFVNGCFWHGHTCRSGRNRPSTRTAYWIPKLDRNRARDKSTRARLRRLGWDVLTIWECEAAQLKPESRSELTLSARISSFLES